ncbi:hypothetical protein [Atlantibacter sp.]|uniref:hypothetical protein n=1 Tax=Atlantibacter sp. TaxID=1903473 RepID=UPI0028A685C3|nr:hypothetical protein [Atlantibacter sp.]
MTFTKLTKERLEQYASDPRMCNINDEIRTMARELLESRADAEPVAWQHRLVELSTGQATPWKLTSRKTESTQGERYRVEVIPLYTRPQPAPVVPDEIDINDPALDTHRKWMAEGWNRCRAAMLQGKDEPVSQPYTLPDDKQRLDWLDAQNKRLNEYYGTAYGWKFDANFQRNAMMLNDSNYPVMNVRQAIDEAMRTATRLQEAQEVKK